MFTPRLNRPIVPVFGALAAVAALAACTSAPQGTGGALPVATSQTAAKTSSLIAKTTRFGTVPALHHTTVKSWIAPEALKRTLLYTSDYANGTVDIYNYAKPGKLYGQITGFSQPYGQCVDNAGDVYVVDFGSGKIYEFSHGGTTPIATATDSYGYPIGCSVDPATGNVAVANFQGYNYSTGGMDVFAGGLNGSQKYYTSVNLYFMWPPGYDRNGNLFVEGYDEYDQYTAFAEMPHGGNSFEILAGVDIGFPAGVQRFGQNVAVADQGYQGTLETAVYTVSASGSQATVIHTSVLTDSCFDNQNYVDAPQPFVEGTPANAVVVAGNTVCSNRFDYWNLANGGNPMRTMPANIAPTMSYGQSVSHPK